MPGLFGKVFHNHVLPSPVLNFQRLEFGHLQAIGMLLQLLVQHLGAGGFPRHEGFDQAFFEFIKV